MKSITFIAIFVICLLIVFGCAKQAPIPVPDKAIEQKPIEQGPRTYEVTLVKSYQKPLMGQGSVLRPKLLPEEFIVGKGDSIRVINKDIPNEQIRIIKIHEGRQTKFKEVARKVLNVSDSLEFMPEESGMYRVICVFSGCFSTFNVQ